MPPTEINTYTDTEDAVPILTLVTHTTCLLWSSWVRNSNQTLLMTVLPASDTLKESKHVRLLLLPYLVHVGVGSHFGDNLVGK